ncbi:hypothetical protein CH63R_00918 [Colletotrichum higginsianum IMI 349063]|uniref:Uncharacterized protein n=1 Tax=Colletotrichum higginsianum (strain IMI 349063) TaxID=759273 RepID=A0A1B7YV30_COLHI|nr:hypothetical protein CH63R_00918 [Colletotrichum higginsianum IMI 349063]OBR15738.1 hypothetical protein CH63R_00918 [Colletotrichum higginsianum IMI 349063]
MILSTRLPGSILDKKGQPSEKTAVFCGCSCPMRKPDLCVALLIFIWNRLYRQARHGLDQNDDKRPHVDVFVSGTRAQTSGPIRPKIRDQKT